MSAGCCDSESALRNEVSLDSREVGKECISISYEISKRLCSCKLRNRFIFYKIID